MLLVEEPDRSGPKPKGKPKLLRLCLMLLGIGSLLVFSIMLENQVGIPFKTTYRVACAIGCLIFIAQIGSEYRGERWPWIALSLALLFNVGLFFSPLAHQPGSKGDILFFGVPDAAIVLAARTKSYRVIDDHSRAVRQQMILGLVLAFGVLRDRFGLDVCSATLSALMRARSELGMSRHGGLA